ncbi:MAG: hypothetical protein AB7L09_19885 [Nitrospira sp.]
MKRPGVSTVPLLAATTRYLHIIWLDYRVGIKSHTTARISLITYERRETPIKVFTRRRLSLRGYVCMAEDMADLWDRTILLHRS